MGIHGLTKVIADHAASSIKQGPISQFFGRKVAVDASMSIYQFLISVRQNGEVLTNENGETTSHLYGLFFRTIRMIENGIKPLYVFDGSPPTLKSGELAKRVERRKEAENALEIATEDGNAEEVNKFTRRLVKVTKVHNEECKRLLTLMGIPVVQAPCEAEAQCAALAKAGKVYATGSEDMDTLTFASPVILRHLTFSEARKMPISEITLSKVLEGLQMDMDQGIGPQKAVALIKEHKCLEKVVESLDKSKYIIPEDWPYKEARELFKNPKVIEDVDSLDLKWTDVDEEGLVQFLVKGKNFSEDRVRKGVQKLVKHKNVKVQNRMDSFFKPQQVNKDVINPAKRKAEEESKAASKEKTKGKKKVNK